MALVADRVSKRYGASSRSMTCRCVASGDVWLVGERIWKRLLRCFNRLSIRILVRA